MGTTTATILCTTIDASTTECVISNDLVVPAMTYGDILIGFFLFIFMLSGCFGFIIRHFLIGKPE